MKGFVRRLIEISVIFVMYGSCRLTIPRFPSLRTTLSALRRRHSLGVPIGSTIVLLLLTMRNVFHKPQILSIKIC